MPGVDLELAALVLPVAEPLPPEQAGAAWLDVHLEDLGLDPAAEITQIGGGFNSRAFRVGASVVKVSKRSWDESEATAFAETLLAEMQHFDRFLGTKYSDHMILTSFDVAESVAELDKYHVAITQPFVAGLKLGEHLAQPNAYNGHIVGFLRKCLRDYQKTGIVVDLANIEGLFRVSTTSNLVIPENGMPKLVDNTLGKAQRSRHTGPWFNRRIASGVQRQLSKLEG